MKKKLEADLISIAHRILKLKNKSELAQLHQETQKLYEKLSVLKFVEENFSDVKPTIGLSKIEELLATAFDKEEIITEEEVVSEVIEEEPIPVLEVEIVENEEIIAEESEEIIAASEENIDFEPHFELFKKEKVESKKSKKGAKQISFGDMLGLNSEPIFERVQSSTVSEEAEVESEEIPEIEEAAEEVFSPAFEMSEPEESEESEEIEDIVEELEVKKSDFSNDTFSKTISFGLNDKIAFEKQLFGGSSEDLNRVISQLSTFDTFDEAENFIEDMVKPDYNNWEGKDDYVARFMEIVEKKFV